MKIVTNILLLIFVGLLYFKQLDAAGEFESLHPNQLLVKMTQGPPAFGKIEKFHKIAYWLNPGESIPKFHYVFIPMSHGTYFESTLRWGRELPNNYFVYNRPICAYIRLGDDLYFTTKPFKQLERSNEIFACPPNNYIYIALPEKVYSAELVPWKTGEGSQSRLKRRKLEK